MGWKIDKKLGYYWKKEKVEIMDDGERNMKK